MNDILQSIKYQKAVEIINNWFNRKNWQPFDFQYQSWSTYLRSKSGLIQASTGTGKTFAASMGPVIKTLSEKETSIREISYEGKRFRRQDDEPLKILSIIPLRAFAKDTMKSLQKPVFDLGLKWSIKKRTGDTETTTHSYYSLIHFRRSVLYRTAFSNTNKPLDSQTLINYAYSASTGVMGVY